MSELGTLDSEGFSTIYLSGTPPFGLSYRQYKALGDLAQDVHTDQANRAVRIPHRHAAGAGWSVTAPTRDIVRIRAVAQGILSGELDSLPARTRAAQTPTEGES